MNIYIVTGVNKGLGKSLHEKFLTSDFSKDEKIFISRRNLNSCSNDSLTTYLNIDFSEKIINFDDIYIPKEAKRIIFINNAGSIQPIVKASDIDFNDFSISMRVNFESPFKLAQYLTINAMDMGIDLLIINVTTGAAFRPIKGWIAYCTSKAAIKMAFDTLAEENEHVTVEHFDPGVMDTDMQSTIRSVSQEIMPDVDLFKSFKINNQLLSTDNVAEKILKLLRESN